MKKYIVTVTETKQHSLILEAESETHAEAIIAHLWSKNKTLQGGKESQNVDFCAFEVPNDFNFSQRVAWIFQLSRGWDNAKKDFTSI